MAKIEFSWGGVSTRTDGSSVGDVSYRLYENGALAVDDIAELKFSLLMDGKTQGLYRYHVTAVDDRHLESLPSNEVAVSFFAPTAPAGLTASFAG